MRTELRKRLHQRQTFTATFQRYGCRPGGPHGQIMTCCFEYVTDSDGEVVAGHIWLDRDAGFAHLSLRPGDVVTFEARVTRYPKGWRGERPAHDYCLSHPARAHKRA